MIQLYTKLQMRGWLSVILNRRLQEIIKEDKEKISESHYMELLSKISINGTQENENSTRC